MKVKIRYCGQLKQGAGCAAEAVDLGGELSAQELIASVAARHGEPLTGYLLDESGRLRATVLAFVNEEQVDWETARPLGDGDELVFMSAIAGG
jgi:molybdopterin converting factor small subunit